MVVALWGAVLLRLLRLLVLLHILMCVYSSGSALSVLEAMLSAQLLLLDLHDALPVALVEFLQVVDRLHSNDIDEKLFGVTH